MASFKAHVMAVDRVERRLKKVTAALDRAKIPYAVVGGNAVAAWVGGVDPGATRATKDVDLLVNQGDLSQITQALEGLSFKKHDLKRLALFTDPEEPSKKSGVHLVWAGKFVRPSNVCPAPLLDESVRSPEGYLLLTLAALVRMKLTSFRDIDRVHIADLLNVGLIDMSVRKSLPPVLLERLKEIESNLQEEE